MDDKERDRNMSVKTGIRNFIMMGVLLLLAGFWLGKSKNSVPDIRELDFPSATVYEIPVPLPRFSLTDDGGQEFNEWNLSRKWTFMFFGYTFCPDVCPTALVDLNDVYNNLLEKGDLIEKKFKVPTQFVFVSVDPGRDTPEDLKEYMNYFNEEFIGVTGASGMIDRLARPMGAAYRRVPGTDDEGDYFIDHSASFLLIDPLGRLRASFPPPHDPGQMADDFRNIRNEFTAECCLPYQDTEQVIFDYRKEKK